MTVLKTLLVFGILCIGVGCSADDVYDDKDEDEGWVCKCTWKCIRLNVHTRTYLCM